MEIDWWTLGLQTINFLIVVWLLSRFLYRPVRRMIAEREETDRRLAEEAKAKAEAADLVRADYERKLGEFAALQRKREANLQAEMEKARDAVLAQATDRAHALLSEAREKLAREREETLIDLKAEIVSLASDLAKNAVGAGTSQDAILRQTNDYLDGLSSGELDDILRGLTHSEAEVTVVTAAPVDADTKSSWLCTLAKRFGDGVKVRFEADERLLGGAEIRFPHAMLDLSVAQRLREATEQIGA